MSKTDDTGAPTPPPVTDPSPTATGQLQALANPSPSTPPTPVPNPAGGRRVIRVVQRGRPQARPWSIMVLVAAAVVSFLVVGQLRGPDPFQEQLQTESEGDLARILASLSSESAALQQELGDLKVDLANIQNSSQAQEAADAELEEQLNALRVLSGTVPVTGPGIQLVIDDAEGQVTFDALVDAVQELRDAGAEAMAANGRRIGVASSFGQRGDRITLDGVVLPIPYTIDAIGPADTLEGGLRIPGGTLDTLGALSGVGVDVHRVNSLELPALEQALSFRAARPVGSEE